MPYLTLWDKISQNLAFLEGNSHKKFKSHRIFRPFYNTFLWRNKHKSHTVVVFTSFLNENKDFRLYWGNSKVMFKKISQNFVKSPLKFCLISQILVHSLWHVCRQTGCPKGWDRSSFPMWSSGTRSAQCPAPLWKPSSTSSRVGASRSAAAATRGSHPQSLEKCHTTGSASVVCGQTASMRRSR